MDKRCPIYQTASFIGKRWTLLILTELYKGRAKWKRYNQIKSRLPEITPKILSARLRELEGEGMITKRVDSRVFPIKSNYCLTKKGEDFIGVIYSMKRWALRWKLKSVHCENVNCKYCK